MGTLASLGVDAFVEIGPQPTLVVLGQQCLADAKNKLWLPSLRRKGEDWQQMLEMLAALYVRGAAIDWAGFDRDYVRHKVARSVPTYPFQRKRYWIDFDETRARQTSSTPSQVLHPLLHRQIHSALAKNGEILFESTISFKSLSYLTDHRVYEKAVLPTTAYLEMAMAAGASVFKNFDPSTALRTGFAVENVSIQQAMILSDDQAQETTVQMVLTPSEAGYGWQVFSRANDSPWTLHASGNIVRATEVAATTAPSRPEFTLRNEGATDSQPTEVGFANVLQRLESPDHQADITSRYQQSREQGIDYGPAFQGVEKLFHGDGEALGHIRLPEDLTASEYTLHPALLDACLQVGGSIFPNEPGHVYLPTGLARLTQFENGAHASVWCHAQVKSEKLKVKSQEIDFDLYDEQGRRIAQLCGLSLWSVSRQALLGNRARTDWLYRIDWQASKRAGRSPYTQARGSWLILADEKGIGAELAARLEKQGERVVILSEANAERLHSAVETLRSAQGDSLRGVVYLANGAIVQQDVPDTARDLYAQALQLTQHIVQSGAHPRVWFVTQDAVAVGQVANLSHAPLWGLGRTIAWEHPELQCTCVDVDKATTNLFDEIWFADNETQVALRNGQRRVARLVRHHETAKHPLTIDAQGSYLITGGLGGLGLQVAQWLVAQGARNLTLVGRSRVTEATQPIIAELENAGARIQIVRGDVSQRDDAARMLSASQALAPLKGIIHAAGVLDDGIVLHQTVERFERVSAPKVQGSWYLHTLSENLPLDFFVCFSSVVSLMGNAGQANYAAANAFMDALAHQRRAQGLPALSINWGAWAEVGLAAEVARRGEMEALTPQEGIELLEALMRGTATQVGAMPITWSKFQRQFPASQNLPLLAELLRHTEPKKATAALKQQLAAAPAEQRYGLLKSHLQAEMSAVLGTIPDDSQRFVELGMTSLTAIQLANRLSNHLGVALPVTSALEYPTIELLTNRVAELVFNGHAKRKPSQEVAAELKPVARDRDMPLSLSQQQLWQRAQLHPDGFARNLAFYYRLDGKLNVAVLRASLDEMMRRHEILRTSFALKNDSPVQVIAPNLPVNLSRIDLRNAPEPSKEIERRAQAEMHRPFDFATAPLWRVTLMQLGDGSFVLGLVAHHMIMDVASVDIFVKELGLLYSALLEGKPSPLPALPIQYADYAYWQRQTLTSEVLNARRNYWKQWLAEEPPPLKLTIDQPRPPVETFRTGSEWRQISPELTRSIATVSQQSGVTPFTTVLTSFVMLLHRYSGSEKIVVGVPLAGRNHQLLESLIGEFETGTFPLCIELQDQPGFVKLLKRIQRTYLSALAVGDAPVEPLVRTLQPERDLRRHPLCRVLLNWLAEIPGTNLKLADVTVAPMHPEGVLGRDLVLNVWEEKTDSGIALRGQWFYRAELFEPGAIAKMADDFRVILEQIVATPAQ
jgi:NAD(P)-dependent dehydrogenase (short-subunit alcohol dehydrogenase family)/acyl carrier protein